MGLWMGASMCQLTVRCRASFCSKRMMRLREDTWEGRKTLHKLQRSCYWAGMKQGHRGLRQRGVWYVRR